MTVLYSPAWRRQTIVLWHSVQLASLLAWHQIRSNYRRSVLGPWWLTLGIGVQITAIAIIFPAVFGTDRADYAPYLAAGIVVWNLVANVLIEGARGYTEMQSFLLHAELSPVVPPLKVLFQNLIVFFHHLVLLALWFLLFPPPGAPNLLGFLAGLTVLLINLAWLSQIFAIVGARFRDYPPLVVAALNIAFFLTPILWQVDAELHGPTGLLAFLNPLHHMVDSVRSPLLGGEIPQGSLFVGLGLVFLGISAAILIVSRFYWRVPYWV